MVKKFDMKVYRPAIKKVVRKYKKGAKMARYRGRIPRTLNTATFPGKGFPKFLKVKMIWDNVYETVFSNTAFRFAHNCIGLYQPDQLTPLTSQPMYYDQFQVLYNKYTVIGSKITYEIMPEVSGVASIYPYKYVSFINNDGTGPLVSFEALAEYKDSVAGLSPPAANTGKVIITRKWSTRKNNSGSILGNDELSALAANTPVETPKFELFLKNAAPGNTNPNAVLVHVRMEYIVIWHEMREIARSATTT